jgi:hypothetical protein
VPLSAALLLSALAALVSRLATRGRLGASREELLGWLRSDAALALAIVLEGYVALTSSKNQGTAFALPWLPVLIVLVCAAVATIGQRPLRIAAATLLAAVALLNLATKADVVSGLSRPQRADLPVLGEKTVIDGRGLVQIEVADAGYPTGPPTEPMPALQKEWLPFAGELARSMTDYAEARGEEPNVGWGFDDLLLNNTRVGLGSELALSRSLPTVFMKPFPAGDSAASYRQQLEEAESNLVIVGERGPGATGIHLTRGRVETAARELGFGPVKSLTAPDGRELTVWWRRSRS